MTVRVVGTAGPSDDTLLKRAYLLGVSVESDCPACGRTDRRHLDRAGDALYCRPANEVFRLGFQCDDCTGVSEDEGYTAWSEELICDVQVRAPDAPRSVITGARQQAYAAIDSERDHQDRLARAHTWQRNKEVGSWLTLMTVYLQRAQTAQADTVGDAATLPMIRKLAALAVCCLEQHGAPMRATTDEWSGGDD